MRIVITGALGYVGPLVVSRLRSSNSNAEIVGIDTGWFADQHDGTEPSPEIFADEVRYKDIRDLRVSDFHGVTHVVHLAAVSNDPMGDRYANVTEDINHRQAVRLAQLAREAGVSGFVFASSASVYGAGSDSPRSEASELAPQTAYARSKVSAETELTALANNSFTITCLRFATACGWSPRIRLDLVLNDFVASAVTTGKIEVLSDGTPWRPLIHVKDMARAVDWAVSDQRGDFGDSVVVNVGSPEWNFQIRDLALAVSQELGGIDVSIAPLQAPDKRSYRLDFAQWQRLAPNHQPMETLKSAITELGSQLGGLPDLDSDFRSSKRIRLVRLEQLRNRDFLDDDLRWTFTQRTAAVTR